MGHRVLQGAIRFIAMLAVAEPALPQIGPELPEPLCHRPSRHMAETKVPYAGRVDQSSSLRQMKKLRSCGRVAAFVSDLRQCADPDRGVG